MKKVFDEVVLKTPFFTVAQDWEVPIPAFFIISCNRPVRSVAEFTDEEAVAFGLLVKQVRRGMQEVNTCDEVYVFQNEDSRHGFHLWLLPRYEWMEQYGRKVESVRPILEHAQQSELTDILINEVKKQATKLQQYLQTVQ